LILIDCFLISIVYKYDLIFYEKARILELKGHHSAMGCC